jgi:hypothetical protein
VQKSILFGAGCFVSCSYHRVEGKNNNTGGNRKKNGSGISSLKELLLFVVDFIPLMKCVLFCGGAQLQLE